MGRCTVWIATRQTLCCEWKKASENVFHKPCYLLLRFLEDFLEWTSYPLRLHNVVKPLHILSLLAHVSTLSSCIVDSLCDCLHQEVSHYRNHCLVLCMYLTNKRKQNIQWNVLCFWFLFITQFTVMRLLTLLLHGFQNQHPCSLRPGISNVLCAIWRCEVVWW